MKMSNLSTQAPPVDFSNHNKSHSYTSTLNMGDLIPIWWQRVYPNDRVKVSHEVFVRFAPLVFPLLAEVNLKLFTFYCPTIATWNSWKKFYSEKPLNDAPKKNYFRIDRLYGNDPSAYCPTSLADYLGMPMAQFFSGVRESDGTYVNDGLPLDRVGEHICLDSFVVYQKIYNRYFRDENLEPDIFDEDNTVTSRNEQIDEKYNIYNAVIDTRGQDILDMPQIAGVLDLFRLRRKAWEKDLFTSSLPTPQFGDPVNVPMSGGLQFDVDEDGTIYDTITGQNMDYYDGPIRGIHMEQGYLTITISTNPDDPQAPSRDIKMALDNSRQLKVAGANFTINDLRMASAVQRYQESLMRAGHRYEEQMRYQFDQVVPNASLREPELLAASSVPIQISEVTQTSESSRTPLGTQGGQAFGYNNGNKSELSFHAPDNGYMMTIAVVVPRTSYMNGLDKEFQLFDRLDYFNPIFEQVGDEPIFNKELYLGIDDVRNNEEFGYIPRYAREKVGLNRTTGEMTNTLLRMNLSRNFGNYPVLNHSFIEVDKETVDRGFAVEDSRIANNLWMIAKNNVFMRRPMQYNPIPKLL